MILIDIDRSDNSYTIIDTVNDNSWEYYDAEYVRHFVDNNDILHIDFTSTNIELPVGCCVLNINKEDE